LDTSDLLLELRGLIARAEAHLPADLAGDYELDGLVLMGRLAAVLPDGEQALGEALLRWEQQSTSQGD
jgi:hypothetical protein